MRVSCWPIASFHCAAELGQNPQALFGQALATSCVVLSTVRHAADTDYRLVVVEDACADRDDEVHRVLTGKVFPRQATVTTTAELVAALGAP